MHSPTIDTETLKNSRWLNIQGTVSAALLKLLDNRRAVIIFWFCFAILGTLESLTHHQFQNYITYKYVFHHAVEQTNLYLLYPGETLDVNLYGPVFSLVIAPFTYLPDHAGALLWVLANAAILLFAILQLPVPGRWKNILLLLSAQELMITSASFQTNAFVCASLLLGFSYSRRGKEPFALFFILLSTFVKVYGVVGLVFFLFSKRKIQFALWAVIWSIVFFFAPLLITNLDFLLQSYSDWFDGLELKAAKNISSQQDVLYQNVSVPGMVRRIFSLKDLNDLFILIPAGMAFYSQFLRLNYVKDLRYQLYILCSLLLAVVIFSTGSESCTYIIAVPGMILWYLMQPSNKWTTIFFIAAFLLTSFAYSDLLTGWSRRHLYKPYSLKALFPFVIWMILIFQVATKQFLKAVHPSGLMPLIKV